MSVRSIFLVGLMGAGKTTVGRRLAEALQLEFMDSDHEVERRTGANIPLIFDVEGEAGFRRREAAVIDELTQRSGLVLATGGGAVLDPQTRRHLADRGLVIYLSASLDQLWKRTSRDRNRPLLQTQDPRAKLKRLMEERDPLYREVADVVVVTDKRGVRHVVTEVLRHPALAPQS